MGEWEKDKDYGEEGEVFVAENLHLDVEEYGRDYRWDILEKDGTTHEVKTDRLAPKTGNHFVETHWRGHWSGIKTTEADWWQVIIPWEDKPWEIITVETQRLREGIRNGEFKDFRAGGDDMGAKGVLIPIEDLRKLGLDFLMGM
jgi:hypothetical protein